ncbi:M12 family metallo-peptidase [Nocardia sp. NPDC050378]|uniref:M12 family metallo-peptidase n=1 Tax=Nocardia sp. NPDC050378 TaxID=3155400 RepID=UPI0033D5A961
MKDKSRPLRAARMATAFAATVMSAMTITASVTAFAAPGGLDTGSGSSGSANSGASGPVIDLLVYYTPEVLAARGSEQAVLAAIDSSVRGMNDALARSEIAGQVRVTTALKAGAGESVTGRGGKALDWLRGNSGVQQARDQYKADLVSLVITGGEGVASLPNLPLSQASAGATWSVVGNDWLEPDLAHGEAGVFAHELGHNLGAMHDWGTSPGSGGEYPERHGHVTAASHVDIMAYNTSPLCKTTCQRKPYYSNPDVTVEGEAFGRRGGEHPSDLASVFALTIPVVAAYR